LFNGAKPILVGGSFRATPLLPKPIRECGDIRLVEVMSAMFPVGALMFLLRLQVSVVGVLQGLSGAFMSGQVIGAGTMGMFGLAAALGSYLL